MNDIKKFLSLLVGLLFSLSMSQVYAAVVLYDGGTGFATGIQGLNVGGTTYDVEFVGGSYDSVYGSPPTFFGDETSADTAADAIMAVLNGESSVPTISAFNAEILWVPYALDDSGGFFAEQLGHNASADPWQRFGDFFGPKGVDWPANNYGWYFTQFTVVPIPAAVWLFGSGLLGLVGMARRKKA